MTRRRQHPMPSIPKPARQPACADPEAIPPVAGLGRRLMAMLYDSILLIAVLFCVAGAYFSVLLVVEGNPAAVTNLGGAQTGDVLHELEVVEPGWIFYPLMLFVYTGFYLYFWRYSGQTLGMRAWKIRLVSAHATKPSMGQLLVRLPAAAVSLAALGLGYLCLLLNREAGTWHDRLSKTRVIEVDPAQSK